MFKSFRAMSSRFFTLFAVTALGMTALLPAAPALAHEVDPPSFPLRFPQETEVTKFTSSFGAPRSGGRRHGGNDLMAPKMTEVYAAAPGIVRVVGTSRKGGRYIELDHLGGWTTMYVHLNNDTPGTDSNDADWSLTVAREVEEGEWVTAGQLIGWVGDSGNAEGTGSHTHFELAFEGEEIDPYELLTKAYERDHERHWTFLRNARPDVMT